LCTE